MEDVSGVTAQTEWRISGAQPPASSTIAPSIVADNSGITGVTSTSEATSLRYAVTDIVAAEELPNKKSNYLDGSNVVSDKVVVIEGLPQCSITDADVDVELEADAESIASSGSDESSQDDLSEVEYFRFSREGLSISFELDVPRTGNLSAPPLPEAAGLPPLEMTDDSDAEGRPSRGSSCRIISFEACCREQYPPDYFIGGMVSRYSDAPTADKTSEIAKSSVPSDETLRVSAARNQVPKGTEDRLTAVITDIMHRLNRQGVLADPRAVCKKGGGRSGEFYERDDSFFDDADALEQLGVPADDRPEQRDMDEVSDEESLGSQEEEFADYDYPDISIFTFDDLPSNDEEPLVMEVPIQPIELLSSSSSASETEEAMFQNRSHWIKRKAWKQFESQLPGHVTAVLAKLEAELETCGTKHGLFVEPKAVLSLIQNAVEEIFSHVYPTIPWTINYIPEAPDPQDVPSPSLDDSQGSPDEEVIDLCDSNPVEGEAESSGHSSEGGVDQNGVEQIGERIGEQSEDQQNGIQPNEGEEKPQEKRKMCKLLQSKDLVSVYWAYLDNLRDCLTSMTSVFSHNHLQRWWTGRLVLHNQQVYNALEDYLVEFILKKSPLFRKKGSHFFRNVKKAVDVYLKSLAVSSDAKEPAGALGTKPAALGDVVESPFFTTATELLNWAIVYNCRRHELKEMGEMLDDWSAGFASYVAEKLNFCISKRRQGDGKASVDKADRIWIPVKFMEETLKKFKQHFLVATLYERKTKRLIPPTFVQPCRCLRLAGPRPQCPAAKKASTPSDLKITPQASHSDTPPRSSDKQAAPVDKLSESTDTMDASPDAKIAVTKKRRRNADGLSNGKTKQPRGLKKRKREDPQPTDQTTTVAVATPSPAENKIGSNSTASTLIDFSPQGTSQLLECELPTKSKYSPSKSPHLSPTGSEGIRILLSSDSATSPGSPYVSIPPHPPSSDPLVFSSRSPTFQQMQQAQQMHQQMQQQMPPQLQQAFLQHQSLHPFFIPSPVGWPPPPGYLQHSWPPSPSKPH